MSREKQIEEMAKIIHGYCKAECLDGCYNCIPHKYAEKLYNAGYRKQNEWISVDERLPKNNDEVLVCAYNKALDFSIVSIDRYNGYGEWEVLNRDYNSTVWSITHWMPLPEAPKMKGGAE